MRKVLAIVALAVFLPFIVYAAAVKKPVSTAKVPSVKSPAAATKSQRVPTLPYNEVLPKTSTINIVYDDFAERSTAMFSQSRARSTAHLLGRSGLTAPIFPLSKLSSALDSPAKVCVLVLITSITQAEKDSLLSYIKRGGKLIAFDSSSPALASLFSLEFVDSNTQPVPVARRYVGWSFTPPLPMYSPATIESSTSATKRLRIKKGAPADVRIAGYWRTSFSGVATSEPSAFRTAAGWWFNRVLYEEGSQESRSKFLLSIAAALEPSLWKTAAKAIDDSIWGAVGCSSLKEARSRLLTMAPRNCKSQITEAFKKISALDSEKSDLFSRGLYGAATAKLWEASSELRLACATAKPLRKIRSGRPLYVWMNKSGIPAKGEWGKAADELVASGVTDVLLWAGSPGYIARQALEYDPFPEASKELHRRGIRLHAWVASLSIRDIPVEYTEKYRKAGNILKYPNGKTANWLDPAAPATRKALSDMVQWFAKSGYVDGVNLDYIRYCDGLPAAFRDPDKITEVLRFVRSGLNQANLPIKLTASVYAMYPSCVSAVGQNWGAWLDEGLIDAALPMNYVATTGELIKLEKLQERYKGKLYSGIAAVANGVNHDSVALIEQLRYTYNSGYAGAAIYAYDPNFVAELQPALERANR